VELLLTTLGTLPRACAEMMEEETEFEFALPHGLVLHGTKRQKHKQQGITTGGVSWRLRLMGHEQTWLSERVSAGVSATNELRARANAGDLAPPNPEARVVQTPQGQSVTMKGRLTQWLKREIKAYAGPRTSPPKRVLPPTEQKMRQQLAKQAQEYSTKWAGDMKDDFQRAPFVVHRNLLDAQLRGSLNQLHKRTLPSYSSSVGGHVHDQAGQRVKRVVMPPELPKPPPRQYTRLQLFYPNEAEQEVVRRLIAADAAVTGRPANHIGEMVLLLAGPGMQSQDWHMDASRQFLGSMVNASTHTVEATQFIDRPTCDLSMGANTVAKCQALHAQWQEAESPDAAYTAAKDGLLPGDGIHTNPLHVHRAPPMPPLPGGRPTGAAVREEDLRRTVFLTYGKHVSAEAGAYFTEQQWWNDQKQKPKGAEPEGAEPEGAELEGAEPEGAELEGAEPEGGAERKRKRPRKARKGGS
jgi:hypothetical protein